MLRDELKQKIESVLGQEVKLEHPALRQALRPRAQGRVAQGKVDHGDFAIFKIDLGPARLREELGDLVDKVEVAPPGFVNFWLSKAALSRELELALEEGERYGSSKIGSGKTLVIDYSSPNIAKRFGIGHLRSTIIGQAIYNLYGFLGWETIGDNHLGDWGTQFGALLAQIRSTNIEIRNIKKLTVDDLEELYVKFNKRAQEDPELWEEARAWFRKLEEGDKEARKIWEALRKISLEEFERIYSLLGVKIDHAYGESFYEDMLDGVIKEAQEKGVATEDQEAIVIKYPSGITPGIIRKSDGATTYLTRDLATVKFRLQGWNPNLVVYEVGAEQSLHFQQLFQAIKLLGWRKRTQFVHVKHGLYLSPEGKKFATRKGETVRLEDVLDEAIKRASELAENEDVARAVGIGAVKYFDLSHHPSSDIVFDWEKIFQLEGNSAPYLQYTFARTQSVLRKVKSSKLKVQSLEKVNPEELSILRTFYRYPEVVREAAEAFTPNLLCNFLFDLAQKYNTFYNRHRIIGNDFRLALTKATGNILKSGLLLLGIEAPERM